MQWNFFFNLFFFFFFLKRKRKNLKRVELLPAFDIRVTVTVLVESIHMMHCKQSKDIFILINISNNYKQNQGCRKEICISFASNVSDSQMPNLTCVFSLMI